MSDEFETTYAVPIHCDGCVKEIKEVLGAVKGISEVNVDSKKQMLSVKGSVAPSLIIETLRTKGNRDAIIRGTGDPNSSAVCILETTEGKVKGLVRMVEIAKGQKTVFDVTVSSSPGTYNMSINSRGDISRGIESTGAVWCPFPQQLHCDSSSSGKLFFNADNLPVWKLIGRSIVLQPQQPQEDSQDFGVCGIIARSAGVWENDKQVCACSGKTVWEERKDALQRNIH